VAEVFFDTNILLYLLSADTAKADKAEDLIAAGGCISIQVLNEFASVTSRKLGMPWKEIREVLEQVRAICGVIPLTVDIHEKALDVAQRYQLSLYDSLIVAAALDAGCKKLYSEDLQHGQVLSKTIRIVNPFIA
jgi:predicted nucleic acid-binding protein